MGLSIKGIVLAADVHPCVAAIVRSNCCDIESRVIAMRGDGVSRDIVGSIQDRRWRLCPASATVIVASVLLIGSIAAYAIGGTQFRDLVAIYLSTVGGGATALALILVKDGKPVGSVDKDGIGLISKLRPELIEDRLFNRAAEISAHRSAQRSAVLIVAENTTRAMQLRNWVMDLGAEVMVCLDANLAKDWIEDMPEFFEHVIVDAGSVCADDIRDIGIAGAIGGVGPIVVAAVPFSPRKGEIPNWRLTKLPAYRVPSGEAGFKAELADILARLRDRGRDGFVF